MPDLRRKVGVLEEVDHRRPLAGHYGSASLPRPENVRHRTAGRIDRRIGSRLRAGVHDALRSTADTSHHPHRWISARMPRTAGPPTQPDRRRPLLFERHGEAPLPPLDEVEIREPKFHAMRTPDATARGECRPRGCSRLLPLGHGPCTAWHLASCRKEMRNHGGDHGEVSITRRSSLKRRRHAGGTRSHPISRTAVQRASSRSPGVLVDRGAARLDGRPASRSQGWRGAGPRHPRRSEVVGGNHIRLSVGRQIAFTTPTDPPCHGAVQ